MVAPVPRRDGKVVRILTTLVGAVAVLFGAMMILVAFTLGNCSAFGGTCPRDVPPLWDDDTFGIAAAGAALVISVPIFLHRPSWRRLLIALGAGLVGGLVVGLMARAAA